MGTLIKAQYTDFTAIRFDGVVQQVYVTDPSFQTDVNGSITFRVRFPVVRTMNGSIPIFTFASAAAGNDAYYYFSLRYRTDYAVPGNYFDILYRATNGGTIYVKSGKTAIAANTWYSVTLTSTGKIYVNAVEETYQTWSVFSLFGSGWFGGISGSSHEMAFGCNRSNGGVTTIYGRIDLNELRVLNSVPSGTEITELYNGGVNMDPNLYSAPLRAKITDVSDFENRLTPFIGSNTFTPVGSGAPNYITP